VPVEGDPAPVNTDLSVLVPPFRCLSADPEDQNFCDGLTEEVLHKLAQIPRLRVITESVAARLGHIEAPKPHYLLEASVRRAGAEIRLVLQLMEMTGGGSTRFSKIYQATINNVFTIQEQLAEEIRRDISAALLISKRAIKASSS